MIELFDTEWVVTSTINGRIAGTVPNVNYNTVVPQPFTHHLRDGVRPAIENRVSELEGKVEGQRLGLGALQAKVDRMDNDISELNEFEEAATSLIEELSIKLSGLKERIIYLESLQRNEQCLEEIHYGDIATHHRRLTALEEALRIFPCRT